MQHAVPHKNPHKFLPLLKHNQELLNVIKVCIFYYIRTTLLIVNHIVPVGGNHHLLIENSLIILQHDG
uniref:Uncharacterized protein n=1 Tax=Cannabis sativa TaxID=3483 RepID=A0A803R024_CANSA